MEKKYQRILDLKEATKSKSIFLLGPRQTGKSFLLQETFPSAPYYNLLLSDEFFRLTQRPSLIREELEKNKHHGPVIIDEIQKLPILLDEVHYLIEKYKIKFILTGSSARKLKRGGANLLGGRARTRHLFPLTYKEIDDFDLLKVLNFGSIPSIYLSDDPREDLISYLGNYLNEEIQAEGVVRKVENFSRFLQFASLVNTELINFESLARDAAFATSTLREYFQILEDTLVGKMLLPYSKTKKRKAISFSKFFFFDVGVANLLAGRENIKPKTELFGKVLEHFIFTEIRSFLEYSRDKRSLNFWRTRNCEVDFIIGDDTAIEVKAAELVTEKHLKGLKAISEEINFKNKIVISLDKRPRKLGDIDILPVDKFLQELWSGSL